MSRKSKDQYKNGILLNGYDYENQAWVIGGVYMKCGHSEMMGCDCYGTKHAGEACKVKQGDQ